MSFALWNCVLFIFAPFSSPSWCHGQKIISYFWPTSLVWSMEDLLYVCKAQRSCQLSFTASFCVLVKACCITGILRAISKCLPSSQPEISTCSFFLIPVERTVQQSCQNHNLPTYKQYSPFLCPNHQPPLTVVTELLTVNYWYSPGCPGWLHFSLIRIFFSVAVENFKQFWQNLLSSKLHLGIYEVVSFSVKVCKKDQEHILQISVVHHAGTWPRAPVNYLDHALSQSSKHQISSVQAWPPSPQNPREEMWIPNTVKQVIQAFPPIDIPPRSNVRSKISGNVVLLHQGNMDYFKAKAKLHEM